MIDRVVYTKSMNIKESMSGRTIILLGIAITLIGGAVAYVYFGGSVGVGRTGTGLVSRENNSTRPAVVSDQATLDAVAAEYKKSFRDGCELTTPTSFEFDGGKTLSVYLATCVRGSPEMVYRTGTFMGYEALYEDDKTAASSTFPAIVILKKITPPSTAPKAEQENIMLRVVGQYDAQVKQHLKELSVKNRTSYPTIQATFQTLPGGRVIMFMQDTTNLKRSGFFDRTMISVTP
jgi:hypothetical protein